MVPNDGLEDGPVGVSVHFVSEGIDNGPVVHRRQQEVIPGDTLGSLLHRNHHQNKWQATAEAMIKIRDGHRNFDVPDHLCIESHHEATGHEIEITDASRLRLESIHPYGRQSHDQ